ncbi:MAG TPA: amidohydrolase family protein [Polyangiaceae bacterium]|jgi:imidazolonepropionase-like amidohydrolase
MSGRRFAAAAVLLLLVSCAEEQAAPRRLARQPHPHGAIHGVRCGVVWDPQTGAIDDGRIVFDGDRVAALGPASSTPREGEELDLRPLFCMPGLVDAHTHLTSYAHERGTDDLEKRRKEAARNAALTLHAGITSVRDLGGSEGVDRWLRDRIAAGSLPGPRMQCAGSQIGTDGAVGGPAGARAAVDAHADAGFDVIKLFATAGSPDPTPLMTAQEILAATEEAHARNLRVAVHAIASEGIARAIAAHVDSIEHAQELTVEQAKEMAAAGITLVPTLYILRYYIEDAENLGFSDDYVAELRHTVSTTIIPFEHRFPAILETGVRVAMGSDAFMALHGKNARELGYLVKAGMTPEQALTAATASSAALLGWDGKVGSLRPGAFADVIAMKGDPRKDIAAVEHVSTVLRGGAVAFDDHR